MKSATEIQLTLFKKYRVSQAGTFAQRADINGMHTAEGLHRGLANGLDLFTKLWINKEAVLDKCKRQLRAHYPNTGIYKSWCSLMRIDVLSPSTEFLCHSDYSEVHTPHKLALLHLEPLKGCNICPGCTSGFFYPAAR